MEYFGAKRVFSIACTDDGYPLWIKDIAKVFGSQAFSPLKGETI
jgi:hypothetical protein